jgi:hypothetical protein
MPRRLAPTVAVALVLVAVLAAPAAAAPVDVPATLGTRLAKVVDRTPLAVLVPDVLDLDVEAGTRVYASSAPGRARYAFSLAAAPGCGGATACFLASLSAERGGEPAFRARVRLRGGIPGWFKPLSCGASCSPAVLQFRRRGVLYEIQAKLSASTNAAQRAALVRAANAALRIGPR